jgi:chromosomal replication initiation ATPase DnaA
MNYYAIFYTDIHTVNKNLTTEDCMKAVEDFTGFKREVLKIHNKKRELADTRFLYFRLACETTRASLSKIGEMLDRDHSTVLNGNKQCRDIKELDNLYKKLLNSLYNKKQLK